jgi:hypothetical protein
MNKVYLYGMVGKEDKKMNDDQKINEVEQTLDGSLEDIPDFSDRYALIDFVEYCRNSGFIDYDGTGYYATPTKMSRMHRVKPSDICEGRIDYSWTHVIWFNR